jgi:hypothetical protein
MKTKTGIKINLGSIYKSSKGVALGFKKDLNQKTQELSKRFISKGVIVAILINLLVIFLVLILKNSLPPEAPLFFGLPEGESQLVKSEFLIIPASFSLFIIIVNNTICYFSKNDFLVKILLITSYVATFFSTIATLKIFLLIGRV